MQQEIEFQICSPLPVKSCKIASISYTSRAINCAFYLPLEFYFPIINSDPVLFCSSNVQQEMEFKLVVHSQ